jgi:ABC-type transport system involved in multi-copper enzyme maturation permease subunit
VSGLLAATRAEWLRLAQPRRLLLCPLTALLAAGYAWAFGAATASGLLGSPSGFYVAAGASGGVVLTLALVGALLAATGVASDLSSGVARTALCRPVSRQSWLTGRILALCVAVIAMFACAELGALASGALRYGLGAAYDATAGANETVLATRSFLAGQLAIGAALSAMALCATIALGTLIGTVTARVGGAVVGVAVAGAALTALSRWPRVESLLPLQWLTAALDRVAQLSQGLAVAHASDGAWPAAVTCLVWAGGASILAAATLRRKDILT